ncbi:MAG: hypothetical protein J0I06_07810 [Planctomycetes bacterium]|nr:hypothetical protein [Planctomycetota bacterium]
MKVADFQKCLRAIGELISTKTPARELTEAADALTPFAAYTMGQFAEFLKAVEAKYGENRELPNANPARPAAPRPQKAKAPKPPAPTVDELLTAVAALKVRLRTDQSLTKDGVATELTRFRKLSQAELFGAVRTLGIQAKQKNMTEAFNTIVNNTISAQGGVERSDA